MLSSFDLAFDDATRILISERAQTTQKANCKSRSKTQCRTLGSFREVSNYRNKLAVSKD